MSIKNTVRPATLTNWTDAGRALLAVDPKRFATVLELAQRMVKAHEDPMSVPLRPTPAPSVAAAKHEGA